MKKGESVNKKNIILAKKRSSLAFVLVLVRFGSDDVEMIVYKRKKIRSCERQVEGGS